MSVDEMSLDAMTVYKMSNRRNDSIAEKMLVDEMSLD